MDETKRQELLARREALKENQKKAQRLESVSDVTSHLEDAGVSFEMDFEDKGFQWMTERLPWAFSGIDWSQVADGTSISYGDEDERDRLTLGILETQLTPERRVRVRFGNATCPELLLSVQNLKTHFSTLADHDMDLWVICEETGFCLECYHEGTLGWVVIK